MAAFRASLRSRLILLLIGTTAPLLLLSLANAWFSYRAERLRVEAATEAIARGIAVGVSREVQRVVAGLQALALSRPVCAGDMSDFREQVASFVQQQHRGANVLLSDTRGQQLLNLMAPPGQRLPMRRNLAQVQSVVTSGRPQVSDLYEGTFLDRVVTVDVPVVCGSAGLRYVLSLTVPLQRLRDVLLQQAPPPGWSVLLVDSRGGEIAALESEARQDRPFTLPPQLREALALTDGPSEQLVALSGVALAFSRAADLDWAVVVERPLEGILNGLWRSLMLLAGSALLLSLAGAWIAVAVARTIVGPIDRLSRMAAQPAGPDRPLPPSGMREIDVVAARLQSALDEVRLAARRKDDFLATLAHELRNPLAPVGNALALLQRRESLSPEGHRLTQVAERQLRQMRRLIDDLLDLGRIGQGKFALDVQHVDLRDCAHAAVETVAQRLGDKQQSLAVRMPGEPLWVRADAGRMAQVLANLLDNASKYSLEGARIELQARTTRTQAEVIVRDDGLGMQPEHLQRVFDMYWQVGSGGPTARGLGIGLGLVQRLLQLHGGTVEAASEGPGRGSTFTVRLPLAPGPAAWNPRANPESHSDAND